jgi:NAD(P)H-dependent FMN reductase
MHEKPLRVAVVVGSTRVGRLADSVVKWFVAYARRRNDIEIEVVDLLDYDLPARLGHDLGPDALAFRDSIAGADAVIVATPEYNHGYPGPLKAAIDLLKTEWHAKPVGFVSYGGVAGGLRAVEQLRQVFAELHAVSVRDVVSLPMVWTLIGEDGVLNAPAASEAAADKLLDQLVWWGETLAHGRSRVAYAA